MSGPDYRLGQRQRVVDRRVFEQTFEQGVRFAGRLQVLWVRRGEGASLRLGVVASKRTFHRAVDRNRARRLLRESYRLNRHRLKDDADVILVARAAIRQCVFSDVVRDFLSLAGKAGLLAAT